MTDPPYIPPGGSRGLLSSGFQFHTALTSSLGMFTTHRAAACVRDCVNARVHTVVEPLTQEAGLTSIIASVARQPVNEHVRHSPFAIRPGADPGDISSKSACSIARLTADILSEELVPRIGLPGVPSGCTPTEAVLQQCIESQQWFQVARHCTGIHRVECIRRELRASAKNKKICHDLTE